ncbi:hypothetical protein GGR52DRAFT_565463 [Hypoxylon sp. FL1284]|nr:hypothetical protein GGR52DRAFT_565463 [Hypoxylon sp. FL1284]
MRLTTLLSILLAPLSAVAVPTPTTTTSLSSRFPPTNVRSAKTWVVTPPPCVAMSPPPSERETRERFDKFAQALIYQRNLTKAFAYISASYVNHDPAITTNGPDAALDALSTFWNFTTITPIRQTFKVDQGWLNYKASGMGVIVDRFRFEAGCIVEHWDAGQVYPRTRVGRQDKK